MSDTPIDRGLDGKTSTRWPDYLLDAIDAFREEYNAVLRESEMSEDAINVFLLDSTSDARRRLVDLGLGAYASGTQPFGFALDPDSWGDEGTVPVCPHCGEDEYEKLRVGATPHDDGTVSFETVGCLSCGERSHLSEVMVVPTPTYF